VISGENKKPESLLRIERLTGKSIQFQLVDLMNKSELEALFKSHGPFSCVIHFAALKAVGESCAKPLMYYKNNLVGSINLFEVGICKLRVFIIDLYFSRNVLLNA